MICPICKDDLLGRTRCSSYCEGYRDAMAKTEPREAARRRQGLREGFDLAANLFWRGVCEQMARPLDEEANEREGHARGWRDTARADELRGEAAQLRKWASE